MRRKLATLPPECTLGNAKQVQGAWTVAWHTEPGSVQPATVVFSVDTPVKTRAFRVAFNPNGLRVLDKIEVRDADGNWSLIWSGTQPDVPAICEYVWFQQNVESSPRPVAALRLSFHSSREKITTGFAGLLQEKAPADGA